MNLPTFSVLYGTKVGVYEVHLVPVDAAGPDHATIAEIHGLLARENAGGGQVTIILVTAVPETKTLKFKEITELGSPVKRSWLVLI